MNRQKNKEKPKKTQTTLTLSYETRFIQEKKMLFHLVSLTLRLLHQYIVLCVVEIRLFFFLFGLPSFIFFIRSFLLYLFWAHIFTAFNFVSTILRFSIIFPWVIHNAMALYQQRHCQQSLHKVLNSGENVTTTKTTTNGNVIVLACFMFSLFSRAHFLSYTSLILFFWLCHHNFGLYFNFT